MDLSAFVALVLACAPQVHPDTARALVTVESRLNPNAIGVVGATLVRQPRNRAEALATIAALQAGGWDFSVGIGQINVVNFARLGLTPQTALDPCTNLAAMQTVLGECFERASSSADEQTALRRALSCYYSGDFTTGMRKGYVGLVVSAARATQPGPTRPASSKELKS